MYVSFLTDGCRTIFDVSPGFCLHPCLGWSLVRENLACCTWGSGEFLDCASAPYALLVGLLDFGDLFEVQSARGKLEQLAPPPGFL
jgi:hypothetical protein